MKGSRTRGLVFVRCSPEQYFLSGNSDSDLAGDEASSRTTVGYFNRMGIYGAVSFHCSLERKICTSSQQGETYAFCSMVKDTVWLRLLLHELGMGQKKASLQRTDNQGVHLQSSKQVNHSGAKHFRISQAYIRAQVNGGVILSELVRTTENGADIFTKGSISVEQFHKCMMEIMGPQDNPSLASSKTQ